MTRAAVFLGMWLCAVSIAVGQEFRGSVKDLGVVTVDNALRNPRWMNLLQGRLESAWTLSESVRLQADGRVSLRSLKDDHQADAFVDRLHASYRNGAFEAHAGRQRINWGKTMVWNPNDVFNPYAYLDVDQDVRPSTDAVLASLSWGVNASADIAASKDVAAAMLRGSIGTYDVQVLAARMADQWVLGGGWSGYVGSSGFKGEGSWFTGDGSVSLALGADHMLGNGLMLNAEVLRNGGFDRNGFAGSVLAPPTPESLFPAPSAYMVGAGKAVNPLVAWNVAAVGAITRDLTILMPQVSVSLTENLDMMLLAQVLRSWESNSLFLRLRWAF
jgi:hypothetical protein